MLNVIANTVGLPPGLPGLPPPPAAMQAMGGGGGGSEQWPEYPLQPVVARGAQHPPPSTLGRTFESFGRDAVGLITRYVWPSPLLLYGRMCCACCCCCATTRSRARLAGCLPACLHSLASLTMAVFCAGVLVCWCGKRPMCAGCWI
jgi:hypothetical protein